MPSSCSYLDNLFSSSKPSSIPQVFLNPHHGREVFTSGNSPFCNLLGLWSITISPGYSMFYIGLSGSFQKTPSSLKFFQQIILISNPCLYLLHFINTSFPPIYCGKDGTIYKQLSSKKTTLIKPQRNLVSNPKSLFLRLEKHSSGPVISTDSLRPCTASLRV